MFINMLITRLGIISPTLIKNLRVNNIHGFEPKSVNARHGKIYLPKPHCSRHPSSSTQLFAFHLSLYKPVSSSYTNSATELDLTFVGPLVDRQTQSARASQSVRASQQLLHENPEIFFFFLKKKFIPGPFPFFRRSVIPEGFRAGHESTARVYYTSLPPTNLSAALIRLIYPKAVNVRSSLTPCIIPPFSFIYHSSQWGFSLKLRRLLPDYLVKFTG